MRFFRTFSFPLMTAIYYPVVCLPTNTPPPILIFFGGGDFIFLRSALVAF